MSKLPIRKRGPLIPLILTGVGVDNLQSISNLNWIAIEKIKICSQPLLRAMWHMLKISQIRWRIQREEWESEK